MIWLAEPACGASGSSRDGAPRSWSTRPMAWRSSAGRSSSISTSTIISSPMPGCSCCRRPMRRRANHATPSRRNWTSPWRSTGSKPRPRSGSGACATNGRGSGASSPTARRWSASRRMRRGSSGWPARAAMVSRPRPRSDGSPPPWCAAGMCPKIWASHPRNWRRKGCGRRRSPHRRPDRLRRVASLHDPGQVAAAARRRG